MWLQILKKDLMKQKTVNIILFLFITLSTIFLASSVNNICLVMNGLETYMEYANVSDVTAVFGGEDDKEAFERWLDSHSEVTEYEGEQLCEIAADDISTGDDEEAGSFEANGASLYLGAVGGRYARPLDSDGNDLVLRAGEVAVSPGLMERIMKLAKRYPRCLRISFTGSCIMVARDCSRNHYEAGLWRPMSECIRRDILAVRELTGLVEELNMNTRIWTKE